MKISCLRHMILRHSWGILSARTTVNHIAKQQNFATTRKERKSKVPQHPVITDVSEQGLPPSSKVDLKLVQLLEKLSLVDFANKEGLARLEEAIRMADKLSVVDTEGVEPMVTVLEDRSLALAEDEVTIDDISEELLACSKKTLEDYFVVPPGNIPYLEEKGYYNELKDKNENL